MGVSDMLKCPVCKMIWNSNDVFGQGMQGEVRGGKTCPNTAHYGVKIKGVKCGSTKKLKKKAPVKKAPVEKATVEKAPESPWGHQSSSKSFVAALVTIGCIIAAWTISQGDDDMSAEMQMLICVGLGIGGPVLLVVWYND